MELSGSRGSMNDVMVLPHHWETHYARKGELVVGGLGRIAGEGPHGLRVFDVQGAFINELDCDHMGRSTWSSYELLAGSRRIGVLPPQDYLQLLDQRIPPRSL